MCAVVNKKIIDENSGSSINIRAPSIKSKKSSAKFFAGGLAITDIAVNKLFGEKSKNLFTFSVSDWLSN